MRETIDFRLPERDAAALLEPGMGVLLDRSTRQVVLSMDDPRVQRIGDIDREFRQKGLAFFMGWRITRRYTKRELHTAELLQLIALPTFEPEGEACGTRYDESKACQHCGAGAPQLNDLHLDVRSIPRKKDLVRTLAGEVVVSVRLAEALQSHGLTGAQFLPVRHKTGALTPEWRQLVITSRPVNLVPPTRAGKHPFDLDEWGEYRCPLGHTLGLHRLSELWVEQASHDGSDFVRTLQSFGGRQGVLRPEPALLISQRLYQLLAELKARPLHVEVAHWGLPRTRSPS